MAEGRSSGFFTRHMRMKSENSLLKVLGSLRVGGGLVGIMKMAWSGGGGEVAVMLVGDTYSHGVDVSIRWSALCHLHCSDA